MIMAMRSFSACLFLLLWLCATGALARAQSTTGVIEGLVKDPSGAVVPGAHVALTHLSTGLEREGSATSSGFFRVTLLPLGSYRVRVTHPGFAIWVLEAVPVTLGSSVALTVQLRVAPTMQKVVVTPGELPSVATQTETAAGFEESALQELPVGSRDYLDFIFLTPNVHTSMGLDGIQIHVNGQKNLQIGFLVDGVNANNAFFGQQRGALRRNTNVIFEAVKEFQVVAEGASPEFGRFSGAFLSIVTKSGGNALHGSLFHLQELEAWAAELSDGTRLRGYHLEQFGGSVGGPIRKDRLFFFGAYEQTVNRFQKDTDLVHCCVSLDAQGVAHLTPPAAGGAPVDLGALMAARFGSPEAGPVRHTDDLQGFLLKLDWIPGGRHTVGLRHSFTRAPAENGTYDLPTFGRSANGNFLERAHSFVGSWNWTLSPGYLNEFRFQYGRERLRRNPASRTLPDTSFGPCTELREFAPPTASCLGRTFRFGWPFVLPNDTRDETYEFHDTVSILADRHTVRVGTNAHLLPIRNFFQGFARAFYLFGTVEDFLNYVNLGPTFVNCSDGSSSLTGACPPGTFIFGPLGAFLQFAPIGNTSLQQATDRTFRQVDLGLFVHDRWQARPGLTIDFGLRWDNFLQPGLIVPPKQTPIAPFLNDPSFPSDGTLPSFHRAFQPRLGIAWDPWKSGKMVVRANGGIFFSRLPGVMMQNAAINNGSIATLLFFNSFFNSFGVTPPRYPDCATGPAGDQGCPLPSGFQAFDPNVILFARDFTYPRTYQWSVWVEREFAKDWTGSAGFNYALGTHLNRVVAFNLAPSIGTSPDGRELYFGFAEGPFSGPGGSGTGISPQSSLITSQARSLYRALTFRVDKKLSARYLLTAHYTYSHDVDDDSNEADQFTFQFSDPRSFLPERGPSNRDQRHQFAFYGVWKLPWKISWSNTITARSASPRSLVCNFDANGDAASFTDRVFTDGAGNYSCGPAGAGRVLQISAEEQVTLVPALSEGRDTGRNRFRRDNAALEWSLRIQKDWFFRGETRLSPTLEIFNLTNHKNFRFPVCDELRDCFVGTILQIPGEPRRLRLGLRLEW